jgi:hypothetical protein
MDPPVPVSPRDAIKSASSEPHSAKKDRAASREPSPSGSAGMIRQTMSLRGPVGSGHSGPGTASEKVNAFSPVGVQQTHMNSFKMETTAKKYASLERMNAGFVRCGACPSLVFMPCLPCLLPRFGRFTVSEAKQVPATQWDAVERQQPGVFVRELLAGMVVGTEWAHVVLPQDALERQMAHDPALRVFSPLMPSLSSIRKGKLV